MTAVYVVATTNRPTVVCPSWCTVTQAQHIEQLDGLEGRVIHWSSTRKLGPDFEARLAQTATPEGVEDPDEPTTIHMEDHPETLSPEEAETAAAALLALAAEMRRP